MPKLIELQAINDHLQKWAKMEWNGTTKMVIMSLIKNRDKLIARGV